MTASIDSADKLFVSAHLTEIEQKLFWQMNVPDQRHVLNVAYTALRLAEGRTDIDDAILIKCALLHDVGKIKGDVSTFDKIFTVLGHYIAPGWVLRLGRLGRGNKLDNLRHAFYIYFHHADRSADMVLENGTDARVADIIRSHHKTPADNDPPELRILQAADELN